MLFKTLFYRLIMPKDKRKVFYAVGVGHKAGVYHTWSECKKQVDGVSNPKFRKFETLQEAEQFVSKWNNNGSNMRVSQTTPKRSDDQNLTVNSRCQEECHGQHLKGDINLKTIEKKGRRYHNKNSYHKDDNCYRKKIYRKYSENCSNYSSKRIYYSWNENGTGSGRRMSRAEENFFYEGKRKGRGRASNEKKREHFPIYQKCISVGVTASQDSKDLTNQREVQAHKTVATNRNASDSNRNSQAVLTDNQIQQNDLPPFRNYSNYQQYPTVGQINCPFGYIQGTHTSSYTEIVNTDIWNIASMPLPAESCLSPLTVVECNHMQESAKNVLNNGSAQTPVDNETDKSPCKMATCKTDNSTGERVEDVEILSGTNDNSVECLISPSSSEGNDVVGCGDLYPKTDNICRDLRVQIYKLLELLIKIPYNEKYFFDMLVEAVDVLRDSIKELSLNARCDQKSKLTHFSKIKVPQSRECRNLNSFSGELKPMVAYGPSTSNDSEEALKYGDPKHRAFLNARVEVCERKMDSCVSKICEILNCFTDIKDELLQLKMPIPCNSTTLSDDGIFDSKISSGFTRNLASQCDDEEVDGTSKTQQQQQPSQSSKAFSPEDDEGDEPPAKRKRTWDDRYPSTSEEPNIDKEIKEERDEYVSFTTDDDDYVVVYTDGSCTYNGSENAKAGIGIWFDDGHPMNVSRPLTGAEPTNNNAEIQAARIACELALSAGISKLKICTDSEFLINCITKWVHKWKTNGWSTGAKQPVKNRVELEKLLDVTSRLEVRWEKVAGHADIKGNEMADRLANEGAARYVKQ